MASLSSSRAARCRPAPKLVTLSRRRAGLQNVVFHELDVQNPDSIASFGDWLKRQYGGLDILINNAGVSGLIWDTAIAAELKLEPIEVMTNPAAREKVIRSDLIEGKACIEINYYGAKRLTEALLPLFRPSSAGARIINVSSILGQLKLLPNESLRRHLDSPETVTEGFLDKTLERFLQDLEKRQLVEQKWPEYWPVYSLSKMVLNAYTRLLARQLENRPNGHKIYANVVHPGWVMTDMTKNTGDITVTESAEDVVWLALHPPQQHPSGQFFHQKQPFDF